MSMMMLNRSDQPRQSDLLKTVIAAEALEQDKQQLDEGLYLERDTLLDDDFFEQSLDDYDDVLSIAENDGWDE